MQTMTINKEHQNLLHAALVELVRRIEECGASPELTHAVSLAHDIQRAIGNDWNPADDYAFERIRSAIAI